MLTGWFFDDSVFTLTKPRLNRKKGLGENIFSQLQQVKADHVCFMGQKFSCEFTVLQQSRLFEDMFG